MLGAAWRVNLGLPDGGLQIVEPQVRAIAALLRCRPASIVAIPFERDRHPDHVAAHALLVRAIFDAGCAASPRRAPPGGRTGSVYYFINDSTAPSFVVDVTGRLREEAATRSRATSRSSRRPATMRRPRA